MASRAYTMLQPSIVHPLDLEQFVPGHNNQGLVTQNQRLSEAAICDEVRPFALAAAGEEHHQTGRDRQQTACSFPAQPH